MYTMGQELVKWAPYGSSRALATIHMIVLPATLGTAVAILGILTDAGAGGPGMDGNLQLFLAVRLRRANVPRPSTTQRTAEISDAAARIAFAAAVMLAVARVLVKGVMIH